MERNLRILRNQRDVFLEQKNYVMLEKIRHEAKNYEEEIKNLTMNLSTNIRSTLTANDVQLIVGRIIEEEDQ